MVSVMFLIFGILDLLAGLILTLSGNLLLGDTAKYIGLVLIGKGIWTIITSLKG